MPACGREHYCRVKTPDRRYNKAMKFLISITQDEDGMFIAECPSIPGCVSQGESEAAAERSIQEAIQECLAVRAEKGMPLTVTVREVELPV